MNGIYMEEKMKKKIKAEQYFPGLCYVYRKTLACVQ